MAALDPVSIRQDTEDGKGQGNGKFTPGWEGVCLATPGKIIGKNQTDLKRRAGERVSGNDSR